MLGLRWRMESMPRVKNTQPPHSVTGVARASSTQLWVFLLFQLRDDRFQRHPADRAVSGSRLTDFWMHRAGVFSTYRCRCGCWSRVLVMLPMRLMAHVLMRICLEFL